MILEPRTSSIPARTRGLRAVAAVAVLGLLATGCGDDDDSETSAPPDTGSTDTGSTDTDPNGESTESEDGDLASFCAGAIKGEAMFTAGPELGDDGVPTPESLEQFSSEIGPAIDSMEQNAPDEIGGEVGTLLRGVRAALEEGDPAVTETPEFFQADAAVDAYVFENCEFDGTQEIVAVDYAFENVPETIEAGQVGIRLDNQGEEVHEAAVLRIDDGVDLSVEELLQLPEAEAEELTEFQGVAFAAPGEQASTVLDLTEGRHVVICFIPVGTTSVEATGPDAANGGPPHFVEGMIQEFQVG